MKPAGQPADFVDRLGCDLAQPLSLRLDSSQLPCVFKAPQANKKRRQQLSGFVMQFARNPAPFFFLRGKRAFQQEPAHHYLLLDFLGLPSLLLA